MLNDYHFLYKAFFANSEISNNILKIFGYNIYIEMDMTNFNSYLGYELSLISSPLSFITPNSIVLIILFHYPVASYDHLRIA